ncbi:hypothetical protein KR067_001432 [Drosophila pandora]|nr:hypothetical protein KR067_001432 [Drosophila pandora]
MSLTWALFVLVLAASSAEHSDTDPYMLDSIIQNLKYLLKDVEVNKTGFKEIGKGFYFIEENQKQSWHTALSICRRMGAHLATFQSEEELNAVDAELNIRNNGYWIDANDLGREGHFVCWTTGSPAPYLKWKRGEPNNLCNKEHCVELWDGLMNDEDCTDERYFICQTGDGI